MSISSREYVPVLKGKNAEISAALKAPQGLKMTPLFELQAASAATINSATGVQKRQKRTPTDAAYFLDDIARLWPDPFYVDISRVSTAPASRAMWWDLLALLNSLSAVPIDLMPVLSPHDDPQSRLAAGKAAVIGRAALRVPMSDVRLKPALLRDLIPAVAEDMDLEPAGIDVVLDWSNDLESHHLDTLVSDTTSAISALGEERGRVIIVGTPNDNGFVRVGDWNPVRREWWLWLRLAHAGLDVTYGDYALYTPSDPAPALPKYGHLRYSSGDRMYVHRRAKPTTGGGLGAAFQACCVHLIGSSHWLGASFSKADQRIADIASNSDKASSAGTWREIAMQHHFALVDGLLASPPAAPPAGTA